MSATVSERAGRWYVSVTVEEDVAVPKNNGSSVGLDVGINRLATLSDGTVVLNPRPLERSRRKLTSTQRALARKRPGSRNAARLRLRLARIHARLANLRRDQLHKLTTQLTRTKSLIVIEDLAPSLMIRNRHLARAISDAGSPSCEGSWNTRRFGMAAGYWLHQDSFRRRGCARSVVRSMTCHSRSESSPARAA
jgi:putative transposase